MFARQRRWILLVPLVLILAGCSMPTALSDLVFPSPTALPTALPTATIVPQPTAVPPAAGTPPPAIANLLNLEQEIIEVYQSVGMGVVNITNRSFAYDFFMRPVPQEGSGSGIVYDQEGHIITNYHVIEDADELLVTLPDETTVSASVVGADPSNDLAVLKVDVSPELLHPVPLGQSDDLQVGQFVVPRPGPFELIRRGVGQDEKFHPVDRAAVYLTPGNGIVGRAGGRFDGDRPLRPRPPAVDTPQRIGDELCP